MICDGHDVAVGVAGIMGGESSEIAATTTAVLIESADFAAMAVGRTARRQNLRTEASTRFGGGSTPKARSAPRTASPSSSPPRPPPPGRRHRSSPPA